jgi:hypothetical protein
MKSKHLGGDFDDFLREQDMLAEAVGFSSHTSPVRIDRKGMQAPMRSQASGFELSRCTSRSRHVKVVRIRKVSSQYTQHRAF